MHGHFGFNTDHSLIQCTPHIVSTFIYSGHSDIVATFPGTKPIYSIIFRSDIVANWI